MATAAVGGRAAEVVSEEAKEARAAGRGLEAGEVGDVAMEEVEVGHLAMEEVEG